MNRIVASAQISLMDYNDAIVTGSMPTNPEKDMLWLNTSVNPHIMKQYTGSEWIIVGELDPEYTEKLEVITGNITSLELTLGNMADDGKLDYGDRQEIVDKLLPIIGYLPVNTSVALKTVKQLDTDKKGSFYQLRQAAQNAGIVTSNTAYTGLASAWNALRTYLGGLDPKPWDLSTVNQDAVAQVDKGTFRTHWLNYYNAEYTLATATTQILHSAISTINTTTLPAMRDSALSSAEKTAIKQSLIILSSEKTAMDGEITGLKANPKLENQTPLNEAKSAYDTSYTGVTTAINAVLAVPTGTLIPSNLILGVENAVSSYSAKLSLLKKEMQDSQAAIAKKVSDDASRELSDSLEGYVDKITYGQDIEEIQNQVDGAITTWFGDNEPTLLKAPAKDWNTTALKDVHLGDLYYDNKSGYAYRFGKDGTRYLWIRIVDADVVAALTAAQNAQDTADGKRRAFYNQPTPPYDIGDLWVQGDGGDLMRAIVTKPEGRSYHINDWKKAVKYTDDTAIDNLEIGGRNLLLNSKTLPTTRTNEVVSFLGREGVVKVSNPASAMYINPIEKLSSEVNNGDDYVLSVDFTYIGAKGRTPQFYMGKYQPVEGVIEEGKFNRIYIRSKRSARIHMDFRGFEEIYLHGWKLEKGNKATDWTPAPEDVEKSIGDSFTAAENYANTIKTGLEAQIDGKVETYNQTADPATGWTAEEKTKHKGDLWYHPTNKITKLWSASSWTTLEDAVATGAQQLAQAKNRVFISTPTTPYEIGDLWVQGTSGDLMRCATSRASGSFNTNDWGKAVKYTDDTKANAAANAASNAQIAANKAQEDATKANGAVSDIISDNKMTPDEKVILQREWLNIQYERNEILSQAERYVIDNASYRSVYDTLSGYLAPFFTNLTTTQDVNGETLRSNFQRYYEQRQAILDAISVATQQKVLDLQTQVDAGPFADKTEILSGTEIFTDKADDSVVHVGIDGKSYQNVREGNPDLLGMYSDELVSVTYASNWDYYFPWITGVKAGEDITAQAWYEPTEFPVAIMLEFRKAGETYYYKQPRSSQIIEGGTSGYTQVTWKAEFDGDVRASIRYPTRRDAMPEHTVRYKHLKVEKGTVATPAPTPSPDYPSQIHSLNNVDVVSSVGKRNLIKSGRGNTKEGFFSGFNTVTEDYAEHTLTSKRQYSKIDIRRGFLLSNRDYPVGEKVTMTYDIMYTKWDFPSGTNRNEFWMGQRYSGGTSESSKGAWKSVTQHNLPVVGQNGVELNKWHTASTTRTIPEQAHPSIREAASIQLYNSNADVEASVTFRIKNVRLVYGEESSPFSQAPEDIQPDTPNPTVYKTNILLSEPLRSVGDAKDRLFRDSDGLWKVERNVGESIIDGTESGGWSKGTSSADSSYVYFYKIQFAYGMTRIYNANSPVEMSHFKDFGYGSYTSMTQEGFRRWSDATPFIFNMKLSRLNSFNDAGIDAWFRRNPTTVLYELANPTMETLPQSNQDKLNSIASFKDSNYLYTIVDKTNILPSYVRDNLKPNLKATFKSQTWYQNYKRGNDLRHFVEVKGLDRAIRFGMLVDYQSFAMPTANWLYFCKIQANTDDFREELVDEDGSIFDYTTQREIKVPKQALDLREVAAGTTGYLAFDTRNELMWFIHYKRNYTYTTNPKTGIVEKIPSSEYWIKWNPGKTGHNTQLVLDESVYIVGEIER